MRIQNTKSFQEFIESQEISADKEKDIEQMIGAFSEYLVAVNPEYAYNKTYLSAYVKEFIQCQKALKLKYQILLDKILVKIFAAGIEQDVWKFEKGKVRLSNTFNPNIVKRDILQLELGLIHENGFVIAEEINIEDNYEKIIDECISTFLKRRKEVLEDETE